MLLYKRRNFYKLFFYEGLSSPFREEISQRSRPNYIEQRSSNSLKRPKFVEDRKKILESNDKCIQQSLFIIS